MHCSHSTCGPRKQLGIAAVLVFIACAARAGQVDFNRDIRPILSENCFACHGPDKNKRKSGLRLDNQEGAFGAGKSEKIAIVPGKPDKSELIARLNSKDPEEMMPPPGEKKKLTPVQMSLLKKWIEGGAAYDKHWSFKTVQATPAPTPKDKKWAKNDIDRFILARLDQEKLKPSPPEEKERLIRRVSLDLTGLPPSLAEVDDYMKDDAPNAFERVVDRLMASPHFGERMAIPWLDLARYADTAGYHNDSLRTMWMWRDWVIKAFNDNKPFSDFTVEQIAGDLVPNSTVEQKIASGFHRNVMTSDEGGLIAAEYLNLYIVDRVNTTGVTWLGLTVGCGQCHDHKYDPLTQRDYYRMYAFFHNVPENGQDGVRERNPKPFMYVQSPEQKAKFEGLNAEVAAAEKALAEANKNFEPEFKKWLAEEPKKAKPAEPAGQVGYFPLDDAKGIGAENKAIEGKLTGAGASFQPQGFVGGALNFDPKGHFEAGKDFAFERTQAFTASAWVKLKNNGTGHLLGKLEKEPRYRGWRMEMTDRRANIQLISTWEGNAIEVRTKDQLPQDAWLHLTLTYDGSSKAAGVNLYVNGKLAKLDKRKDTLKESIVSEAPFSIGGPQNGNLNAQVDDVRIFNRVLSEADSQALVDLGVRALLDVEEAKRTPEQAKELKTIFRTFAFKAVADAEKRVADSKKARDDFEKTIPNTMVMEEMATPRDTFIKTRGAYDKNGEKVTAATPEFLPAIAPPADGKRLTRLDFANWLISPQQPLTSRVAVNRFWAMLFGTGIVKTANDFGLQGEWPSHPELLDWLAADFMKDWNIRRVVKQMVMSATYQQASRVTPEMLAKDSGNRLLARGPRGRLDAEFVRDNALAISGLLNPEMGGVGILPAQPPGIWEVNADMGGQRYKKSEGAAQYRRGLYVYWRRSTPYPSFLTFDAPNREFCTATRARTSTPLQALVLMNDPVYVEAARAFALRAMKEAGSDTTSRLTFMWRAALSRQPAKEELAVLEKTLQHQISTYTQDKKGAEAFVKVGDLANPKEIDPGELAAWTAVANVILNLNETITK